LFVIQGVAMTYSYGGAVTQNQGAAGGDAGGGDPPSALTAAGAGAGKRGGFVVGGGLGAAWGARHPWPAGVVAAAAKIPGPPRSLAFLAIKFTVTTRANLVFSPAPARNNAKQPWADVLEAH
ncbi:hypothetical protein DN594_27540, partial [Enterobacter cloacae]